jgi:hypothetical protein
MSCPDQLGGAVGPTAVESMWKCRGDGYMVLEMGVMVVTVAIVRWKWQQLAAMCLSLELPEGKSKPLFLDRRTPRMP